MKKVFIIALATLTLNGCQEKTEDPVSVSLHSYFTESSLPSAIMGSVDQSGEMTWYAYGPSVWGGTDTVSPDNIFRIYSMTKPIASVAAMQLVEQGLIGLDDPVNNLMPEMAAIPILDEEGNLHESDGEITLKHLLTHTAGFGYDFTSSRLNDFDPGDWNYEDKPRLFEPGTSWKYGTNTDWLGKVIEKISGQDLETYLRENITGPLEMDHTWFNVPGDLSEKIVSMGARDSAGAIHAYTRIPRGPVTSYSAGGGLFSSPGDYLKFLKCMLNYGKYDGGQILQRETIELMLRDHLPEGINLEHEKFENSIISYTGGYYDESDRWGLAWAIEANENEPVRPPDAVYWSGAANSYFTLDVQNGIGIVYFTQFFPFNDKESYDFYRLFEELVYRK
jgi:CubicO group peptidase (beta-lactamase class C family)